jgi:hypothetical protein
MSITTALFLRFGKVIPAYKMTPEIAGQLHKNLAKVMIYVKGKGVKLTKEQADYIINQTKQLDLYEKDITPPTPTGPKADVIDLSKKLPEDAPYSEKNPKGWMPEETVSAEEEARGIRSALGFNENLVNDTINLLKDKDKKSMEQELKKIIMREGTYEDYNDSERKAILDGIQKIMEARGGDVTFAMGGRVRYGFGTGKKGVQGILDLVKNKFGRKSITTADKVSRPESAVTRDMFKQFNERLKQKDIKKQINETYERLKKEEPGIMAEYDAMWSDEGPVQMSMEDLIEFRTQRPAGQGMFTKAEAIRARLENTIKGVNPGDEDYDWVMETFPKWIDEIEKNPSLADNETVWNELAMTGLPSNQRLKVHKDGTVDFQTLKPTHQFKLKDDITKHATGGRVGFSAGGIDKARRAFLKLLGGSAATGVALKSGVGGLLKGNKAKEAAQVVKAVGKDQPPAYMFDLAKIIRAKGKDITKEAQTIERETVKTYKGMDLYESPDGSFRIQADIPNKFGDQARQVELMYAKTDEVVDAGMETQKTVKGEIYEEATVSPDIDGKMKDVDMYIDDRDHAVLKEFVEKEKKKFKSGGLAYMLGE